MRFENRLTRPDPTRDILNTTLPAKNPDIFLPTLAKVQLVCVAACLWWCAVFPSYQ